jgi:hypothetical protein
MVAVRGEYPGSQAPHTGDLSLGEVQRIGKYPVERLRFDGVAVVVEGKREGIVEKVGEDEESGFDDRRSWR